MRQDCFEGPEEEKWIDGDEQKPEEGRERMAGGRMARRLWTFIASSGTDVADADQAGRSAGGEGREERAAGGEDDSAVAVENAGREHIGVFPIKKHRMQSMPSENPGDESDGTKEECFEDDEAKDLGTDSADGAQHREGAVAFGHAHAKGGEDDEHGGEHRCAAAEIADDMDAARFLVSSPGASRRIWRR